MSEGVSGGRVRTGLSYALVIGSGPAAATAAPETGSEVVIGKRPKRMPHPREPERWNPKLKLVEEIPLTRAREVSEYSFALRLFTRLVAHSRASSQRKTTVLRCRFQALSPGKVLRRYQRQRAER